MVTHIYEPSPPPSSAASSSSPFDTLDDIVADLQSAPLLVAAGSTTPGLAVDVSRSTCLSAVDTAPLSSSSAAYAARGAGGVTRGFLSASLVAGEVLGFFVFEVHWHHAAFLFEACVWRDWQRQHVLL
jgi:hypothetical protein